MFTIKLHEYMQLKADSLNLPRLTYQDIYKATGILPKTLSKINQGKGTIKIETLYKLCEYLDCTAGNILWRAKKNGAAK
jgi:Predicted transcriptional regulator